MPETPNGIALISPNDQISHIGVNNVSSSVDTAIDEMKSRQIYTVANVAERTALVGTFQPTTNKPLYVHRVNAGSGRQLERTLNGTTWETIPTEQGVPLTMQSGVINTSTGSWPPNETRTIGTVTFPVPFAGTPQVALTLRNTTSYVVRTSDLSATSFDIQARNVTTGSFNGQVSVSWLAMYTP